MKCSYDVMRLAVNKKTLSTTISNSQHESAESINNDSFNIDIYEISVEYNLDDAIEDDEESKDYVEEELLSEDTLSSKEDKVPTYEKEETKYLQIRTSAVGIITRKRIFIGCSKTMKFELHHTPVFEINKSIGARQGTSQEVGARWTISLRQKYTDEYGDGAASVLHLCKYAGIEDSDRTANAMVKTATSGYCKPEFH
eukprot:15339325-Ditylum_brightwellii.AAC.1